MKYFWISIVGLLASTAMAADRAGEVVFTVGDASVRHGNVSKPLKRGSVLEAGDVLVTGGNGHVHVRMVDQGFISLRPASRLVIEQYRYNPSQPRDTSIKFRLEEGVMRSVTGKGGEAAKDRFRLNTPIAAIGIRGTDFSVYTTSAETRVSISQGGVAVSPFNDSCQASTLGPCAGKSALDLSAGNLDQVLQLRKNDARPALLQDRNKLLTPDSMAPALPEEKDSQGTNGSAKRSEKNSLSTMLPSDSTLGEVAADKASLVDKSQTQAPIAPVVPVTPLPQPTHSKLEWGRWGGQAGAGSAEALLTPERELIAVSSQYALTRTRELMALPERGSFDFKLVGAEAGIVDNYGRQMNTASVRDGALSVDFGKREFTTRLNVAVPSLQAELALSSKGSMDSSGKLYAGIFNGNMNIQGAVSGDGKSAAYLFSHGLSSDRTVEGVTTWQR